MSTTQTMTIRLRRLTAVVTKGFFEVTHNSFALIGLTGVKTRWRTTWGASHLTAAKI